MRGKLFVSAVALGAALTASTAREVRACGGCFHPPSQSGTVVTDHRMIFSISPRLTTLYDQIAYQGSPSSFAWVLPIHGPVRVGLSADILFAAMEAATKASILAPQLPPCACQCSPPPAAPMLASGGGSGSAGVTVISQQVVGPYDTVQLQSTDPNALNAWLGANGFSIPPDVQSIIAGYVKDGFDFLAMRLAPGQGVQAMRPISVTSSGAGLSLPLRMVAAGTGATVGVTLWVVSDGRYEPRNFPVFTISPTELVWDWATRNSTYATLRAQKEAALQNAAWQIESSLDIGPYQIENIVLSGPASPNYAEISSSDAGPGETADQVRQMDLATLFPSGGSAVRITRMRADLSRAALANDLLLQASADQSPLSNVYPVTVSINAPQCPSVASCPCAVSNPSPGPSPSGPPPSFGAWWPGASALPAAPDGGGGGNPSGANANPEPAKYRPKSSGCTMSPAAPPRGRLELVLVSLGGIFFCTRVRRKRSPER